MTREILFRGKWAGNNEWVYGFYNKFAHRETGEQEHFIQTVQQDGRIDYIRKVAPETVGQFTGLTGKNGKKIFEGDIVRSCYDSTVGVVTFGTGTFDSGIYRYTGWHIKDKNGCVDHRELCDYGEGSDGFEIIGNIHDNPELLEVHDAQE